MKSCMIRCALTLALLGGAIPVALCAEDASTTALPTLLIKGEVVSLDTNDPAAVLLKVKDRYGFETPIFVTPATTVTQSDAKIDIAALAMGTPVEVEYNFDVNTAKRHAVSVKVTIPASAAPAPVAAPDVSAAPAVQTQEPAAPAAEEIGRAHV